MPASRAGADGLADHGRPPRALSALPVVARWDDRWIAFTPSGGRPGGYRTAAVVVFAWHDGSLVLADIAGRGWTTPSGRTEPGETPLAAAARETHEEIGAVAADLREIGGFAMALDDGLRLWAPAYLCTVHAFGSIPEGSESRGAARFALADVAKAYYRWDPVLAAAFDTAIACAQGCGTRGRQAVAPDV